MLSIGENTSWGRRDFLKVGALGLGGLSLPWLFEARARAGARSNTVRDKSVILLFLHGGPSQIETFDPKMSALVRIPRITTPAPTPLPCLNSSGVGTTLLRRAT